MEHCVNVFHAVNAEWVFFAFDVALAGDAQGYDKADRGDCAKASVQGERVGTCKVVADPATESH